MKKTSAKPRLEALLKSLQAFKNLPWANKANWRIAAEWFLVLLGLFFAICIVQAKQAKDKDKMILIVRIGNWFIEAPNAVPALLYKLFLVPAQLWRNFIATLTKIGNTFHGFGSFCVKVLGWVLRIVRLPFDLVWKLIYTLLKGLETACLYIRLMPSRIQLKVQEAGLIPKLWKVIRAPVDIFWHIINFFVWVFVSLLHLCSLSVAPAAKIMEYICLPFKLLVAIIWNCIDKIAAFILFIINSISLDAVEDWWNNLCVPDENGCGALMKDQLAKLVQQNEAMRNELNAVRALLEAKNQ